MAVEVRYFKTALMVSTYRGPQTSSANGNIVMRPELTCHLALIGIEAITTVPLASEVIVRVPICKVSPVYLGNIGRRACFPQHAVRLVTLSVSCAATLKR